MGFKISQVAKSRKDLEVRIDDAGSLKVVYNPKSYTVALEDKLEELAARTFQSSSVILMLAGFKLGDEGFQEGDEEVEGLLVDWDLVDDDENPIPIRIAELKKIPLAFLTDVLSAIQEDAKPNKDAGKASAGG